MKAKKYQYMFFFQIILNILVYFISKKQIIKNIF